MNKPNEQQEIDDFFSTVDETDQIAGLTPLSSIQPRIVPSIFVRKYIVNYPPGVTFYFLYFLSIETLLHYRKYHTKLFQIPNLINSESYIFNFFENFMVYVISISVNLEHSIFKDIIPQRSFFCNKFSSWFVDYFCQYLFSFSLFKTRLTANSLNCLFKKNERPLLHSVDRQVVMYLFYV